MEKDELLELCKQIVIKHNQIKEEIKSHSLIIDEKILELTKIEKFYIDICVELKNKYGQEVSSIS